MTRIFLAIITATVIIMACAKKPTPRLPPETILTPCKGIECVHVAEKAPKAVREFKARAPVIVAFAKGSAVLSPADASRLSRMVRRKPIVVTGYASNERGQRPGRVEASRNYLLSLQRAQAVCAAVKAPCTPVAGGETDAISPLLDGNRIAGFIP